MANESFLFLPMVEINVLRFFLISRINNRMFPLKVEVTILLFPSR